MRMNETPTWEPHNLKDRDSPFPPDALASWPGAAHSRAHPRATQMPRGSPRAKAQQLGGGLMAAPASGGATSRALQLLVTAPPLTRSPRLLLGGPRGTIGPRG